MNSEINRKVKSLGLFSGGLDSMLAVQVLLEQKIGVTGISFTSPFFGSEQAIKAAKEIGIPLIVSDITRKLLPIIKNPKHGYGANLNPCIDCHALMIREAGKIMEEEGYDFIFSGEVYYQRPMSQTKNSLLLVAKLSGYEDFLLRPLSAKYLPETRPEKSGLVDRKRLLDIEGRSRKRQIELSKNYGFKEFASPSGGCLLTDRNFSRRLKEIFTYEKNCSAKDLELLKVGRHFRIYRKKVVVGRDEKENQVLKKRAENNDVLLSAEHVPGPVTLVCGGGSDRLIKKAASICARYSKAKNDSILPVIYKMGDSIEKIIPPAIKEDEIDSLRI